MFGFETSIMSCDLRYLLLLLLNATFDMIDGLILVSHASKRWCSARWILGV
ncbi:hypothetical protein Hdeb2414_s0001g00002501 [Helianthus debilis subsp. tardiflorus]